MRALIVLAILLTPSIGYTDTWTSTDSAVQAAVMLSLGLDYLQTRQIISCARTGERCARPGDQESNPVMGERGDRVPAEVYFLTCAALHTGVAYNLPQPYRRLSQVAVVALQTWVIEGNLSAGYGFEF